MSARTLYLIGNGFDIQHNLPTNYRDFREFLLANHEEFVYRIEELYDIYPLNDMEPWYNPKMEAQWNARIKDILWGQFEQNIGSPDIDSMMSFSESAAEGLNAKYGAFRTESTMDAYWIEQYGFVHKLQQYIIEWISSISLAETVPQAKRITKQHE